MAASAEARLRRRRPRAPGARRRFPVVAGLLVAAGLWLAGDPTAGAEPPALMIEQGSVARQQVVALGRDLVVAGEALAEVAAVGGSVRISGRVAGEVIALGGDVILSPAARVDGDVFVLGGELRAEPGARIGGRSAAYPTVSSAWLTLLEGPALGVSALSPLVLGGKLALLAAWMLLTILFFATAGAQVLETSRGVSAASFRSFFVGLTGVLAMLLTALFLSAFAPGLLGMPLLLLVVLLALVLKLWGMVAVFHALGDWLARTFLRRRLMPMNAAVLGLSLLGAVKLVPWVGVWVWTAATFLAVGGSLITKFGRKEAWFGVPLPVPRA